MGFGRIDWPRGRDHHRGHRYWCLFEHFAEAKDRGGNQTSQTEEEKQAEAERKAQEEAAAKKRAEQEKMNQQGSSESQTQQEIIDQHISAGNNGSSMPKTGPEDSIIPVLGLAVVATLFAYNVVMFKKNA